MAQTYNPEPHLPGNAIKPPTDILRLFYVMCSLSAKFETFEMGPFTVPRIWNGLWQLSSNAWGTTSSSQIRAAMEKYSKVGYVAYGVYHPCVKAYAAVFTLTIVSDMVKDIPVWISVTNICTHSNYCLG